jgi:alkyl hydroperoxide reductase subunit F
VPGEDELIGNCIHICASCDEPFYQGKDVLVIGGNSGFEEALFLTRFASKVDIVEYLPEVKASKILQEKVAEKANIKVTVNQAVKAFKGNHRLEGVLIEDRKTGEVYEAGCLCGG